MASEGGTWSAGSGSIRDDLRAAMEHIREEPYQPQPAFPPLSRRQYDALLEECYRRNIKGRWDANLTVEDLGKLFAIGVRERDEAAARAVEAMVEEGIGERIEGALEEGDELVWWRARSGTRVVVGVLGTYEDDGMVWVATEDAEGNRQDNLEETVAERAVRKKRDA